MALCDHCETNAENNSNLLVCGHRICDDCLLTRKFHNNIRNILSRTFICEICEMMSIVPTKYQEQYPEETKRTL